MNPYSAYSRRFRVSALAAVANPSYTRIDTWNLLDDACRHLADVDLAGHDVAHDTAKVKRLMDRLAAYERYWLYPGSENLATFRTHLETQAVVRLSEEVSLAVRLLSEYGDRTALFDLSAPLADQELVAQAKQQQFYTVLLADDSPITTPDCLAESLRALRCPTDDVQFELLVVPSVEDAITAVALNGEIQAAIIRHDVPLRSRDRVPLMNTLLGITDGPIGRDCSQRLHRMRRVDPRAAATYRPLSADRRVDRRGQQRRTRRLRSHFLSAQRRHRSAQHGARRDSKSFRHTVFRCLAGVCVGAGRPIPCAADRAWRQHLQLQVATGHG